jgi:hypothetical protein
MNWHVEVMAVKPAAVRAGRIRRLMICVPPRHLKSLVASVAFPVWCLGHDPSAQLLCASYAEDLADKLSRDCRRAVASDGYRKRFPATRPSPQLQAVPEFETTVQRCRIATSVGGVLTGRGADMIIIDDPLTPEEALSQAQRQAANEWYDHTLYSRLNDSSRVRSCWSCTGCPSLAGHVLAQENWDVVRLPAIAEEDEVHRAETVFRSQVFGRKAGEALHPERERRKCWHSSAAPSASTTLPRQYQQAPSPQGSGMVKAAWFKNYAANEVPEKFDQVVQSWDTANKASELSDFSVCTTWGIRGKNLYLLHIMRRRMEYPELKRAVCEQCAAFEASVVLIEYRASGTQLIQELIEQGLHAVTRYQPQADKVIRSRRCQRQRLSRHAKLRFAESMHAQTAMIENGFVHLPKEAAWLAEYLHELTVFPKGKHDDQVDSSAQMLDWFKRGGQEP